MLPKQKDMNIDFPYLVKNESRVCLIDDTQKGNKEMKDNFVYGKKQY